MARRTPRPPGYTPHQWRVSKERWDLLHPGVPYSKQRARGHTAREHIPRKQREIAIGGLTSQQKAEIRKAIRAKATALGARGDGDGRVIDKPRGGQTTVLETIDREISWAMLRGIGEWRAFQKTVKARQDARASMTVKEWAAYKQPGWDWDTIGLFDMDEDDDWLAWYNLQ